MKKILMRKGLLGLLIVALLVILGAGLSYSAREAAAPLVKNQNSTVFFIVGEMHLGKSQKDVAKVVVDLINEYEIDAVFVEQPDELQYNWAAFKELAADKAKAIAVLQNQMLKDAEQATTLDWGIYKKYFENKSIKTDSDLEKILQEIYKDHGEAGIKDIEKIFKEAKSVSGAWKTYEDSKSVSAADYLYVMLNLQGIKLPFYNIESRKLRDEFEQTLKTRPEKKAKLNTQKDKSDFECNELQARDNYMVTSANGIIKNKGYRQVILICGAAHIDCLKEKLNKNGYEVKVSYDAMKAEGKLKQVMATLAHPDYIVNLVKTQQGVDLKVVESLIVLNRPSKQMITTLGGDLTRLGYDESLQKQIVGSFLARYEQEGMKAKTDWETSIAVNKFETLTVSKKSAKEISVVKVVTPPPAIAQQIDSAMAAVKLKNQLPENAGVVLLHVEKDVESGMFFVGDGSEKRVYSSAADFVDKNKSAGQSQYTFFSMGLEPHKLDAFASEARLSSLKDPNNKNAFIALKQITNPSELEKFRVKTLLDKSKVTVEYGTSPIVVRQGRLQTFINKVVTVFMKNGMRIKVFISAKSAEIEQRVMNILLGRPQWDIKIGGNLTEDATAVLLKRELDKMFVSV